MSKGCRMRVVAVVAHPDDEVLGVGGTLARHARDGDDVTALVLADGATSRYPEAMRDDLRTAGRLAADCLGLKEIRFADLPDQRLDEGALLDVTRVVSEHLDDLRPEVLYTHFSGDVNLDHGVVSRATWTACRPYAREGLRELLAFETASSTEWAMPTTGERFVPTVFVDVTDTLEVKLAAMACYASELRDAPHPRGLEALRTRAAYWGGAVGRPAAEPFVALRLLR
jgi:LmbE family N-acetylglucosaminyl deacetylase